MVDQIIQGKTRTRRKFCSFYTESDPILSYMVGMLDVENGDKILEPCAGDGIFIDKILSLYSKKDITIEALDINEIAVQNLRLKFRQKPVHIRHADTLLDKHLDDISARNGYFSKIIGNPPYGAWQTMDRRKELKDKYEGNARETYTLFMKRSIDLLKEKGRLVFIVPDTFLALHLHSDTRTKLLQETKIEEITLIPSHFFPGVNFGYSNLCIITVIKDLSIPKHKIRILSVENNINNLYEIAKKNYSNCTKYDEISQDRILQSIDRSFLIGSNEKIRKLVNNSNTKLSDIADCVTGFYSGNNTQFLGIIDPTIKGAKKYKQLVPSMIESTLQEREALIDGLQGERIYVPILKGGRAVFEKEAEWFVKWDTETINFYKKDKAARFQNSQYYFREGIGVPMVKSNKISAFLLRGRLFDQSLVGIFPKNKKYLNYLLGFLNSETCNIIIKTINHTANNSSNYLKKLPIILNDQAIHRIDLIMQDYWDKRDISFALKEIDSIFNNLYQIN